MAASQSVRTKVHILAISLSKGREPRTGPLRLCVCVCVFFLYVDVETSQEISLVHRRSATYVNSYVVRYVNSA